MMIDRDRIVAGTPSIRRLNVNIELSAAIFSRAIHQNGCQKAVHRRARPTTIS